MTASRAHYIIALIALLLSFNYIPSQLCLQVLSPIDLIALRFGFGAVVTVLLFPRQTRRLTPKTCWPGVVTGLLFGAALLPLYLALETTHSGVTAFLVSGCAVLVPFVEFVVLKRVPTRHQIIGLFVAIVGVATVSIKGDLSIDPGSMWGLLSAVIFALWAVAISFFLRMVPAIELGLGQIYGVAAVSVLIAVSGDGIPMSDLTAAMWAGLLYLSVVGVAFRFLMQSYVQGYTSATAVEIIFLLEPTFAFLWATILNNETATVMQSIGCAMVVVGVLVAQNLHVKKYIPSAK